MEKRLKQSLGIDVSKMNLSLSLGFLTDKLEKGFIPHEDVPNDLSGYKTLLKWLNKSVDSSIDLLIVMEATGVYHQGVAHYLHGHGYAVCVMQSGRVKRYAQSLDQRSKTDALDSKMLSMLGLERSIRLWHPPSEELQQLKGLSRERSSLLKDRVTENNRQGAISSSVYSNAKALKRHKNRLKLLNAQIEIIEDEMRELTSKNAELERKIGLTKFLEDYNHSSSSKKNLLFVYYLSEILKIESITHNHVFSCYRWLEISFPNAFAQSLRDAKAKNGWLLSAKDGELKVSPKGLNEILKLKNK